jgi:hypothetical protein
MNKISAKQIEGVVDTSSSQNVDGEKTFMSPVVIQTNLNNVVHTMVINGSFVYWILIPGVMESEGNKRLGINPLNGQFGLQQFSMGQWVNFNL